MPKQSLGEACCKTRFLLCCRTCTYKSITTTNKYPHTLSLIRKIWCNYLHLTGTRRFSLHPVKVASPAILEEKEKANFPLLTRLSVRPSSRMFVDSLARPFVHTPPSWVHYKDAPRWSTKLPKENLEKWKFIGRTYLPPIEWTIHITGRLPTPALRSLRLISSLRYNKDWLEEYESWKQSISVVRRSNDDRIVQLLLWLVGN